MIGGLPYWVHVTVYEALCLTTLSSYLLTALQNIHAPVVVQLNGVPFSYIWRRNFSTSSLFWRFQCSSLILWCFYDSFLKSMIMAMLEWLTSQLMLLLHLPLVSSVDIFHYCSTRWLESHTFPIQVNYSFYSKIKLTSNLSFTSKTCHSINNNHTHRIKSGDNSDEARAGGSNKIRRRVISLSLSLSLGKLTAKLC